MRSWAVVLVTAVSAAACSTPVECQAPEQVLVEATGDTAAMTCAHGQEVVDYIEMVAARPVAAHQSKRVIDTVAKAYRRDPAATEAKLASTRRYLELLRGAHGPEAGPLRSNIVYEALNGPGPFRPEDGMPYSVLKAAVAPWATHTEERLVLSEMDVEGWIKYASLCREVQGGGALVMSIGDRQGAYQVLVDRFDKGTAAERRALVSIGPFWQAVRSRWKGASYEDQQRWIAGAPLPPPMTGTSLEYIAAVLAGDVEQHAAFLHYSLGPFVLYVP